MIARRDQRPVGFGFIGVTPPVPRFVQIATTPQPLTIDVNSAGIMLGRGYTSIAAMSSRRDISSIEMLAACDGGNCAPSMMTDA